MTNDLTPEQDQFLLATRCFGRGTPFPHRLLKMVMSELTATPYQTLYESLRQQGLIQRDGKLAFTLTNKGIQKRQVGIVPAPIWDAAIRSMKPVVGLTIEADETASIDHLCIHTVALGNVFRSKHPPIYMEMIGLAIICLDYLGRKDDSQQYHQKLQAALDAWHDKI